MKTVKIRKLTFSLPILMVLSCFTNSCLAQARDFWLKGIRESTGQGYGNIHFVVIDTKDDKVEYRINAHLKIYNDEVFQNGTYLVDSNLSPISFNLHLKSNTRNVSFKGKCSNDLMYLSMTDDRGKVQTLQIPFQDTYFDVILTDLILKRAKEKHFKLKIFDATGLMTQGVPGKTQNVQVDVTRAGKDKIEATVTDGITTKQYQVNQRGRIEQIKFVEQNVRVYATNADDAQDISYLLGSSLEYKTKKVFPNARGHGITKAHMRFTWKDLPFEKFCFTDNRQKPIKQISDNNIYEIVLEFIKANAPSAITKLPVNNEEFGIFLKDSAYIKPNDQAIRQQLVDIRGDEKDAYVIAESLVKWTSGNIKFVVNAPILTGPDVLERKVGHCMHHSILCASLARAAGIPTKMVTGLVNIKADPHRWSAHLWNEVWVGKWIAIDPTRGEFVTGPSHVKFAEASTYLGIQGAVSRLENNLSLEILDFNQEQTLTSTK
ncbi:MAG: transglutaminase-like domain-containing protein [Planctomycetota bacterium]|jgi:hypothetical protein